MGLKSDFKVVIAGGSIAGLTVANMLQMHDIDFVLLESWPELAPQVGASLGLLPHGNRILDQLGVLDKIYEICPPLDSMHFRDEKGRIINELLGMNQSMCDRHGYPIMFLDRQMVLQVLADAIRDKSKLLTNKRVKAVDMTKDGVLVETSDGSTYKGDILIGADGIHSTVRSLMWQIAGKQSPGWFPPNEHASVACDFGCVFGISRPCKSIVPGALNSVFNKHKSYLVNGGPGGRVYWFCFFKLKQRVYGDDIPRFTEDEKKKMLQERGDDDITPTLKFKELVDKTISSTMVPLHEHVYSRWHFQRIVTIGDSAHKFHPIAGHGGNAAIESAATLVNNLRRVLAQSKGSKPTLQQIEIAFAEMQKVRQDRSITLKTHSHEQQRLELKDSVLHELIISYVFPFSYSDDVTFNFSRNLPLAEKLDSPLLSRVPKLVPYKDELLRSPKSRGIAKWYFIAFYLSLSAACHFGMWVWSAHWDLGTHVGDVIVTGNWDYDPGFPLKRTYIGIKPIDDYFAFLTAVFMPGVAKWDQNYSELQVYFLGMLLQPIAIWTVESFRKRNSLSLIAPVSIWFFLVQTSGVGIFMPIWYAAYTYISEPETYWWPLNREVPIQYAKHILWASLIGYALPTFLMFYPWRDPVAIQNFEVLWQPSPLFVPIICTVVGWFSVKFHGLTPIRSRPGQVFPDLPYLKALYVVTGVLGLALHVYSMTRIMSSSEINLASVFVPDLTPQPKTFGQGLTNLFLVDFWAFFVASNGWMCMAAWDLKRMGRTNVNIGRTSALITLGNLIIGPGATLSAVWYWRENALAATSFA